MNRGRTDGTLLNTEADNTLNLINSLDAPAIAQGHPTLGGEVLDQAVVRLPLMRGRVDIKHKKLIDFLLTAEVEAMLRDSAGQIPILPGSEPPESFGLAEVRFMDVDYEEVARKIEEIQPYLKSWAGL